MVISPYYFNLPDSAILHFYDTLAEQVKGSVLLYNFPDRTGHDLSPELIYRLVSEHENIVGIKDTVATMGHTRAIIQKVKKSFPILWCILDLTSFSDTTYFPEETVVWLVCLILLRK